MFELGLEGKVAIITGGSDGLGRATALRLAYEGCHVVICARRKDHLESVAEKIIDETNAKVIHIQADVSKAPDIKKLVSDTHKIFGGIDILINNAGQSAAAGLEDVSDQTWQADIVNATIIGGKTPPAKYLPTTVTRAAGINLTKSLAHEYAVSNIRVNTICIGLLKSEQWVRRCDEKDINLFYEKLATPVPLGRVGEAEEYADLATFLVSDRATYITGAAINIDGGLSAST